ncbi:VPS4-associated protein 1 [Trametes meyenii]|nr:VPS4-associated protein 1 [Trametes meyenii]
MSFTNLYYKRAVGTARACYVCHKPTTTVLATINTVDFLYTCDTHLADPGFASQVGTSSDGVGAGGAKMGLSTEEIAKVKSEWEERQKKKAEKAKEKEKEKEKDDKEKGAVDKESDSKKVPGSVSPPSSTPAAPTPTPTHQRYTLHRDIFSLRLAEHRRRRQAVQAKELAPRLPGAPMTPLPSSPPS